MSQTVLPLAERYERFRDSVFAGVEDSPSLPGMEPTMSELDLQSLWFSGAFGNSFTSWDNRVVTIEDFGSWNAGPGPDFTDCAIRIGDALIKGDIELDPDVRDWERHQHGANPDYQSVVLHVFLDAPSGPRCFTRNHKHCEVTQVQISRAMLAADATPKSRLAAARLGRCAQPLAEMDLKNVFDLIESAAQHRLRLKSSRLYQLIAAHGRDQTIFQSLAQSLGYRYNQLPFTILAQRLPLKRLLKEDALDRQALLFGAAGFLEDLSPDSKQHTTRSYLRQIWSRWWRLRDTCLPWLEPQNRLSWKMSAVRPGNHPQRRLGALSAILENWSPVSTPLLDATRWSLSAWRDTLLQLRHDHWSSHYTLLADPADKPVALIGETRIYEMLANVAYPLLVPERTRLWAEYLELPALLENVKVRRASLRLFGDSPLRKKFNRNLFHHQGLLQIYQDFCLEDHSSCANCPFPERLKEWS